MHLRSNPSRRSRRGIVLLIVLAMLTLFAIAGLTFVLYADAASESARINRGAETLAAGGLPDMDPNAAFNLFLGQLIYGLQDDANGATSSLRGHSLAETMYGSYDSTVTLPAPPIAPSPLVPSDVPYDGTGRLHFAQTAPAVSGQDEYGMVNYMWFKADGFVHDPGRYGFRSDPTAAHADASQNRTAPYVGGQNAPYTYPDVNSMFVATINPATGQITTPSYYRPSTIGAGDWTTSVGKYKILRPRPADMGPGFPAFAGSGDVQNLPGLPGTAPVNDSIWIDIGAPELTTANGIRYKMLVAPLILDLDSKINLNVAGNVLATTATAPNNNAHASNQGWGPWEANIGKVLNAELSLPTPAPATEWQNIFLGNPPTGTATLTGRYGVNRLPTSTFPLNGVAPHVYAPADLDGLINLSTPGSVTGSTTPPAAYALPGAGQGYFPSFDPNAYLNGQMPEHTNAAGAWNHPMYYNPLSPSTGNRLLPLSGYAPFLWAGVNASPSADLRVLCPTNFFALDPTLGTNRRIHESTVFNMDVEWPGASPYTWDSSTTGTTYALQPGQLYPTSAGNTFPTVPPPTTPAPTGSDFNIATGTYRSTLSTQWPALGRLDLNRPLAAYPTTGPTAGQQPPDRQVFAQDILNRLVAVTGMTATYNNGNPSSATPTQYAALRWLAQLSANIVDYIDADDVMTVFQWASTPQPQAIDPYQGYVFGTELPKLVVNEVYLEYDNDSADPNPVPPPAKATQPYHMNVWAELLNPLPAPPPAELAPNPANTANLYNSINANGPTGNPIYQLVITSPNQDLRNPANIVGDPDGANPGNPPFTSQSAPPAPQSYTLTGTPPGTYTSTATGGQVLAVVKNWGPTVQNVTPVGTTQNITLPVPAGSNQGFLVIGPTSPATLPGATPPQPTTSQTQIQTSVTAPNMAYTVANNDPQANTPDPPTILLQRLANPNLLYQPNAALAPGQPYNPYVTVDYVDLKKVKASTGQAVYNDARLYNAGGQIATYDANPNHRFSVGRNQPYAAAAAAATTTWQKQQTLAAYLPLTANQPTTSFFAVNNPATAPSWLVHLNNRPLISPTELLQVSAFKPQELTQQFVDASGNQFAQRGPWIDQGLPAGQSSRLYRLFEFIKASNPTPGLDPAGRVPGKVNINTLDPNAKEVFEALADAEPGNSFYYDNAGNPVGDANVDAAFTALMNARGANGGTPFWGLAPGPYSGTSSQYANSGIANTVLPTLISTGQNTHPYQQSEMLNKLFSNLTTRSNVFAVWLTVGFFQVTNDQVQPMQLGPEINAAQNKNIRHHMFAIVDRTQIQTFSTATTAAIAAATAPATQVTASISIPNTITDARTGRTWQVQPGSTLVYDPGVCNFTPNVAWPNYSLPNEETVVVQQGMTGMTANFNYPHAAGATVVSRGHPGPWHLPGPYPYDPTQDSQVVPYIKIID